MTIPARTPLLAVAEDDAGCRALIDGELRRRYGTDYRIRVCPVRELAAVLDDAEAQGDDVALVLAAGKEGVEVLAQMRGRFPTTRRGLLIPWLGWSRRGIAAEVRGHDRRHRRGYCGGIVGL